MRAKLWPLVAVLWFGSLAESQAQVFSTDPFETLPTLTAPHDDAEGEQLVFRLLVDVSLPGPLPGDGPRFTGAGIEIPVAGGLAWLSDRAEAELRLEPGATIRPPETEGPIWVENERGRLRFVADDSGWLRCQRRCGRCASGWRKKWKLRIAGLAPVSPLVIDKRVCVGTLANRVYCMRTRSGHRLWDTDVGGRVADPLVAWSGDGAEPSSPRDRPQRAVLAVVERGSEVLVLDERHGVKVAGVKFDGDRSRLVGVPLAMSDGRIVLARQGYADADAGLRVYRLVKPPAATETPAASGSTGDPR